jgi:predicted GNAT family acetyltransferase
MKHATQDILAEGSFAFLYADRDNPISNHVYEKIGYKKVGEFMEQKRT